MKSQVDLESKSDTDLLEDESDLKYEAYNVM